MLKKLERIVTENVQNSFGVYVYKYQYECIEKNDRRLKTLNKQKRQICIRTYYNLQSYESRVGWYKIS